MGGHQKYAAIADAIMGRNPPEAERPRRPLAPPGPIPTIGQLMGPCYPKWMWAYCDGRLDGIPCDYDRPVALAQFAILWGLDASSDLIRERLVCSRCGHRGVHLIVPSCDGLGEHAGFPGQ